MSLEPKISVIVARASDTGIGCSEGLPWHIPEELKYFKKHTLGKPVIMGRRTFESIIDQFGKPLPGRKNIVVSRSGYQHEGIDVFSNLDDAIKSAISEAQAKNLSEIFVIGGSEIFKQALPKADRLYLTEIDGKFKTANAFLPNEFIKDFVLDSSETKELVETNSNRTVKCDFQILHKATSASTNC